MTRPCIVPSNQAEDGKTKYRDLAKALRDAEQQRGVMTFHCYAIKSFLALSNFCVRVKTDDSQEWETRYTEASAEAKALETKRAVQQVMLDHLSSQVSARLTLFSLPVLSFFVVCYSRFSVVPFVSVRTVLW